MDFLDESQNLMKILNDVDINIDKILVKLTLNCEIGIENNKFCEFREIQELNKLSLDERYQTIIEMDDFKKLNLLSKCIKSSKNINKNLN
jgi:hypothetical protein